MNKLAVDGGTPVRTKPFPEWPVRDELEEKLIIEVVQSGRWGGAEKEKLEQFEQQFASFQDAKYAVTVNNGTISITAALLAAGVEPGNEVIIPPYTFIATATAMLMFGAIPVFADIDPDTLLIDPEKVEALITPNTKAIVAVHIAGAPADMTRLKEIAARHQIRLIEDAAQAVGAQWEGKGVGALGDMGTFSFQSSKNLTAGEGGVILTNDEHLADRVWSLANVGRIRKGAWYQHEHIGWNLRMTEFQAAILLAQMTRLEEQIALREVNANILNELLREIPGIRLLKRDPRIMRHAYHLYMFCLSTELSERVDKGDIIKKLNAEGIPVSAGYGSLNQNKAIIAKTSKFTSRHTEYSCPISERLCDKEVLWLTHNVLLAGEEDMVDIANAVKKVLDSVT
jgi:dTDP-4-amino-4,6-dideoxygalactose transaminase